MHVPKIAPLSFLVFTQCYIQKTLCSLPSTFVTLVTRCYTPNLSQSVASARKSYWRALWVCVLALCLSLRGVYLACPAVTSCISVRTIYSNSETAAGPFFMHRRTIAKRDTKKLSATEKAGFRIALPSYTF
ncbi:hypothetical protein F5Y01DRAFT_5362 [Xylaria sp. FL0043]|nr:hypothetical protein F5Y01DRAFT_5362 [Xylaria sp. FL0043]